MSTPNPSDVPTSVPEMMAEAASRGGSLTILQRDRDSYETRTYADLNEQGGRFAAWLLAEGIEPGARIGLVGATSFDFVVATIGVWRSGATIVLLPERGQRSSTEWGSFVRHQVNETGCRMVVASSGSRLELPVPVSSPSAEDDLDPVLIKPDPDTLATILYTSGTTNKPKAIAITYAALVHQTRFRRELTSACGPQHHLFWWSPLHTAMSFQRALMDPLTQGTALSYLHPRHLLAEPDRWLFELSRCRATHTGGPAVGLELATRAIERGLDEPIDLTSLEECAALGELVNPDVVRRFFEVAAPLGLRPDAFRNTYASSEASVITNGRSRRGFWVDRVDPDKLAAGAAVPSDADDALPVVSTGAPISGVEVRLITATGGPARERELGRIEVRSPATMRGYLGEDPVGWIATRDHGYMLEGELFLVGRMDDVVIIRGANFSTIRIGSVASSVLPDGLTAHAFGVPRGGSHEIVVVISVADDSRIPEEGPERLVRQELWERMTLSPADVFMIAEDEIPRAAGKVERAELERRYLAGELRALDA
jgi:acyl-CoA synthetase (AMP-forming)/AMP-acid ligase II